MSRQPPQSQSPNNGNDQTLELYKVYLHMLDRSTESRLNTNKFFMSINTFMVTLISAIGTLMSVFKRGNLLVLLPITFAGFLFSLLWRFLLTNYLSINSAKWDVVYDMEAKFSFHPFKKEWDEKLEHVDSIPEDFLHGVYMGLRHPIQSAKRLGSAIAGSFFRIIGKAASTATNQQSQKKKPSYYSITRLERGLPALFALMYLILGIWAFCARNDATPIGAAERTELRASIADVKDAVADLKSSLDTENAELNASIEDVRNALSAMESAFAELAPSASSGG